MKLLLRSIIAIAVLLAANIIRTPLYAVWPAMIDNLWLRSLSFVLTCAVVVAFVWAATRGRFDWQLRRGWGLFGGTLVAAVPVALAWALLPAGDVDSTAYASTDLAASFVVLLFARSFILQGIPEELLFRGWLFSFTKDRPLWTVAWTTAAFVAPHLFSAGGQQSLGEHLLYLALPLGMGILAGAVTVAAGSYWWAAGTHGGMHLWMGVLTMLAPKEMGPTSWLLLGLAQTLTGLALLAWAAKKKLPEPVAGGA